MIRNLIIAGATPLLLLTALIVTYESAANFIAIWPLDLVELTGLMGNSPEGFYNNWIDVSVAFSWFFQSSVLFVMLQIGASKKQND